MRGIANRFSDQMDKVCGLIDLITAAVKLTTISQKTLHSKHDFVIAATSLARSVQKIGNVTTAAYDGAYLTVCAKYELVICNLIETYVQRTVDKCHDYNHLPRNMREWYPEGCARIILNIKQDKLKHLTKDTIVNSLASCIKPSKKTGYIIIGEAFSDNERNFWPSEVEGFFKRIGIEKIWQKLSHEPSLQSALGTINDMGTEQRSRLKLEEILQRRNDIIHRGKTYYTPSETEARECAVFFKYLITNIAEVMEKQIVAM